MYLNVLVIPRGGRDALEGWKSDADGRRELVVRVSAPPEEGKATRRACKLVADALALPSSAVSCARGATSRHKRLEVVCSLSESEVYGRLEY